VKGEEIPHGARVVKVLKDLIDKEASGLERKDAAAFLRARLGQYDPKILEDCASRLKLHLSPEQQADQIGTVLIAELTNRHVLVSPLTKTEGMLIAPSGTEISNLILERIRNFRRLHTLKEPIQVRLRTQ